MKRHLRILQFVVEHEPIGIKSISKESGHPPHQVRYSLRILQETGLVRPTEDGAVPTDDAVAFLRSHHGRIDDVIDRLNELPRTFDAVKTT